MNLLTQETNPCPLFYRQIPLTQGQVALVDVEDYEWLMQFKWHAKWNSYTKSFYARRNIDCKKTYMHRDILGLAIGDKARGDHENHDTLDNRRLNLRLCTVSQNGANSRMRANNTSGYRGVTWDKARQRWTVHMTVHGKPLFVGRFDIKDDAARAFNRTVYLCHGEFATLNDIA